MASKFGKCISVTDSHKPCKFCKSHARDPPLRGNNIRNIPNFQSFGALNPQPEAINVKCGREERSSKFHLDRCNVSPLRGEKLKNRPVSKTIPAGKRFALVLSVIIKNLN